RQGAQRAPPAAGPARRLALIFRRTRHPAGNTQERNCARSVPWPGSLSPGRGCPMAAAALELLLSNLVVAAGLAAVALAAGRWGRRPALTHALWLLVLLKLVTPPVVGLPVRLLPAEPAVAGSGGLTSPGSPET